MIKNQKTETENKKSGFLKKLKKPDLKKWTFQNFQKSSKKAQNGKAS